MPNGGGAPASGYWQGAEGAKRGVAASVSTSGSHMNAPPRGRPSSAWQLAREPIEPTLAMAPEVEPEGEEGCRSARIGRSGSIRTDEISTGAISVAATGSTARALPLRAH